MRSTGVIVCAIDEVVPDLAIPIQRTGAKPFPRNILAAEVPSTGLVLVPDGQRVVQPVLDVGVPEQGRPIHLDVDVAQARRVQHALDIVHGVAEHDAPSPARRVVHTAPLERLYDRRRRVAAPWRRLDDAHGAIALRGCAGESRLGRQCRE